MATYRELVILSYRLNNHYEIIQICYYYHYYFILFFYLKRKILIQIYRFFLEPNGTDVTDVTDVKTTIGKERDKE